MPRKTSSTISPRAHIEKSLARKAEDTSAFRVHASDVPPDTYALLLFANAVACPIERISDSKFQIISTTEHGKKFVITTDAQFRRMFNQLVKAFLPSPDQRIQFLKRGEQYAEACLLFAADHAENGGYLGLHADKTSSGEELSIAPDTSKDIKEPKSSTPASTSALDSVSVRNRSVKTIKPYGVKEYQTQNYGVLRDSSAILEVEYEDGDKAFRCSLCDYERDNHRSINGHMGKHSAEDREQAAASVARKFVMGLSWEPNPRQSSRITRLAHEIAAAMKLGLETPERIASAIIEARSKDPQRDDDDNPTVSEMTPEEQLEAIRRILGADSAVKEERDQQEKLIAGLQNQIDAMKTEMDQVREAKDAADRSLAEHRAWAEKIQAMRPPA